MKKSFHYLVSALLAFLLFFPPESGAWAQNVPTATTSKSSAPSRQEVADAKSKGMVWVNTSTRVYHKAGPAYGTTKHGKFMTEDDAKKAGYREAADTGGAKKKQLAGQAASSH